MCRIVFFRENFEQNESKQEVDIPHTFLVLSREIIVHILTSLLQKVLSVFFFGKCFVQIIQLKLSVDNLNINETFMKTFEKYKTLYLTVSVKFNMTV